MMENIYTKLENFLRELDYNQFSSLFFVAEDVFKEKLYNKLAEYGGTFRFEQPIIDISMNVILKNKMPLNIVEVRCVKHTFGDSFTYEIIGIYDNGEERTLHYSCDRSIVSDIVRRIEDHEEFLRRIQSTPFIHFENEDIIITDPCYVINEHIEEKKEDFGGDEPKWNDYMSEQEYRTPYNDLSDEAKIRVKKYDELKKKWREIEEKYDDWEISDYGKNMEQLGITNYLTHDTIYGDWSCTTFDIDTKKSIGRFCADAGEVSVFSLKEIRAYNPNIDKWIEEHSWCVTKIPNFTGDVYIDVENTSGVYDEDNEYHKKGEAWEEHTVRVIGKGSVNFRTEQTGF